MGLNEPLHMQYLAFLKSAITGDFGRSFQYHLPALGLVLERLPATLELSFAALSVAIAVGIPTGILAATRRGSLSDAIASSLALFGQTIPGFWLGIMLIWIFAVSLHLLPSGGIGDFRHLILPAIALGSYSTASIMRLTRASMLEALGRDYMRTARAKGLREKAVVLGHALPNAAIPIVTIVGLQLGTLLGGAVVTEWVFAWPGVGRLAVQAVFARDYPIVQASVLIVAMGFIFINTALDLLYRRLDPRISRRAPR